MTPPAKRPVITATTPESAVAASGSFHLYGLTNAVILPELYQTWANRFTGFNDRAMYRDSDGDGLANGLEYAFDTDPTSGSTGPITWNDGAVTGHGSPALNGTGPGDYLAIFGRRNDYISAGLIYTVEFSADLATWTASTDTPVVVASDAEIQAVSVPFPDTVPAGEETAAPRFFRVSVSGGN